MKYIAAILTYVLLLPFTANGQRTKAVVLQDMQTCEPIPFAVIRINESTTILSNQNGKFSLPDVRHTLKVGIRHLSYPDTTVHFEPGFTDTVVSLRPARYHLSELEVRVPASSASSIVEQAIERIRQNYHAPAYMRCFFSEHVQTWNEEERLFGEDYVVSHYQTFHPGHGRKTPDHTLLLTRKITSDSLKAHPLLDQAAEVFQKNNGIRDIWTYDLRQIRHVDFLHHPEDYVFRFDTASAQTGHYIICFDQASGQGKRRYKGTMVIDTGSLAFLEIRYKMSDKVLPKTKQMMHLRVRGPEDFGYLKFQKDMGGNGYYPVCLQTGYSFYLSTVDREDSPDYIKSVHTLIVESISEAPPDNPGEQQLFLNYVPEDSIAYPF